MVCFGFCLFVCVLCCFCFVVLWLFFVGLMSLHGDCSMDCVSILIQFYFWCTLSINSLNLQMCNWFSGLLNDLARAIWRWTEKNRRIGAREWRQLIPHVRFQVPFLGPKSQLKSGFACAGLLCSNSICLLLNLSATGRVSLWLSFYLGGGSFCGRSRFPTAAVFSTLPGLSFFSLQLPVLEFFLVSPPACSFCLLFSGQFAPFSPSC